MARQGQWTSDKEAQDAETAIGTAWSSFGLLMRSGIHLVLSPDLAKYQNQAMLGLLEMTPGQRGPILSFRDPTVPRWNVFDWSR